ncbi:hypothetical protein MBLNU230_g3091t1 [Neophaeotheca triangularis]
MPPKKPPQVAAEQTPSSPLRKLRDWTITPGCLALAALISPVSQAALAPVYGAIPSSVNHKESISLSILLGFALQWTLKNRLPRFPRGLLIRILPIVAAWTLPLEMTLFRYSDLLGPTYGPRLTSLASCQSVILLSAYAAAESVDNLGLYPATNTYNWGKFLSQALSLAFFTALERHLTTLLPTWWASSGGLPFLEPTNLQLLIAALYLVLLPSKAALLAMPAFINTVIINTTYTSRSTTNMLQTHLHRDHGWNLIARQWSTTGYISVLDNADLGYRVLRCDHSLLGGEWTLTPQRRGEGWTTSEPIYAVFEMLEAVRLMQQPDGYATPDGEARALVIGLGVGTAPKALLAHGIDTTVVELDPVVHQFATEYFALPSNHTAVLQDAVSWVGVEAAEASVHPRSFESYDYILHDVFTGGAEPLALFTEPFVRNLRSILATHGVIAINYAGEVEAPLTAKILKTIYTVFDGRCRIYGDQPLSSRKTSHSTDEEGDDDSESSEFLNMVVFCRNSPGPIAFRQPLPADLLGSQSRRHYLFPRADWEIAFPSSVAGSSFVQSPQAMLQPGEEAQWASQQAASAKRHWHIMRKVAPSAVWELW